MNLKYVASPLDLHVIGASQEKCFHSLDEINDHFGTPVDAVRVETKFRGIEGLLRWLHFKSNAYQPSGKPLDVLVKNWEQSGTEIKLEDLGLLHDTMLLYAKNALAELSDRRTIDSLTSPGVAYFSDIKNLEKIWGFYAKVERGHIDTAERVFLKIFYQFNYLYNQIHARLAPHPTHLHPEYRYNYFLGKMSERLLSGEFERSTGHLPGQFWEKVFQTAFEKAGVPPIFIRDILRAEMSLSHKQLMLKLPQIQKMKKQLLKIMPDVAKVLDAFYFNMPQREFDRTVRRAENLEKIFHEKQHGKAGQLAWVQATAFFDSFLSPREIADVLLHLKPHTQAAFIRAAGIDNLIKIFQHLAQALPPYNEVPIHAIRLESFKNKIEMPGLSIEEAQAYYSQKQKEYEDNGHETDLPAHYEEYMRSWSLEEEYLRVLLFYKYDMRLKNLAQILKNSKHFDKVQSHLQLVNANFAEALKHGLAGSFGFYAVTRNMKPKDLPPDKLGMPKDENFKAFLKHQMTQQTSGGGTI